MLRAVAWIGIPLAIGASVYPLRQVKMFARHAGPLLDTLPDFAWAFSLGATMALLWRDGGRRGLFFKGLGAALVVLSEMGQGFHLLPGTFDARDLVAQVVGYVAALTLVPSAVSRRA